MGCSGAACILVASGGSRDLIVGGPTATKNVFGLSGGKLNVF